MKTIKYKFNTGKTIIVEVSDDFYNYYTELEKKEKRNDRKESRRHISLEYLLEMGIDFADVDEESGAGGDFDFKNLGLEKEVGKLTDRQKKLLWQIYGEKYTQSEIAKMEKVSVAAISNRLKRILKKLYKNLS